VADRSFGPVLCRNAKPRSKAGCWAGKPEFHAEARRTQRSMRMPYFAFPVPLREIASPLRLCVSGEIAPPPVGPVFAHKAAIYAWHGIQPLVLIPP
jgi:hypothetical protein